MPISTSLAGPTTRRSDTGMGSAGMVSFALDESVAVAEVRERLLRQPPSLAAKFLYRGEGARLFEAITRLPEYYQAEAELGILRSRRKDIARHIGPQAVLVDLGAGTLTKARIVLSGLESPAAYVPLDMTWGMLAEPSGAIFDDWPDLPVIPVVADLARDFSLPAFDFDYSRIAFLFAGTTIGNFEPDEAAALLENVARAAGPGASLLLGVDRKNDRETVELAYNDPGGVTAAFHRNVLNNVNALADGDFVAKQWIHEARYNEVRGRIEARLVSDRAQTVRVAGEILHFRTGDSIHTCNSYKYSVNEVTALAAPWWRLLAFFSDPAERFTVFVFSSQSAGA